MIDLEIISSSIPKFEVRVVWISGYYLPRKRSRITLFYFLLTNLHPRCYFSAGFYMSPAWTYYKRERFAFLV